MAPALSETNICTTNTYIPRESVILVKSDAQTTLIWTLATSASLCVPVPYNHIDFRISHVKEVIGNDWSKQAISHLQQLVNALSASYLDVA